MLKCLKKQRKKKANKKNVWHLSKKTKGLLILNLGENVENERKEIKTVKESFICKQKYAFLAFFSFSFFFCNLRLNKLYVNKQINCLVK